MKAPLSPDSRQTIPAAHIRTPTSHPLIYRSRIERWEGKPRAGDWVAVYHSENQLLGYGLYNPRSEYGIRILRYGPDLPDEQFWERQLSRAVEFRRTFLKLDEVTNAYRVLHGESDGFPGLVVDRIGEVLSAEVFSLGMWERAEQIIALLSRFLPECVHYLIRPGPKMLAQEGIDPPPILSSQLPKQLVVTEFETRFRVRFADGHKTGFFCDQRENRRRLAGLCRGRDVLDLCCYSGGFAIQAKKLGQANEVTGVDIDEGPLKLARENANLNQVRVNFVQSDAFSYMRDMLRNGKTYDVVVLDPPKLITSRADYDDAVRTLFDLNRLAIQLVRPNGLFLSCSCAGLLSEIEFSKTLAGAARQCLSDESERRKRPIGRVVQIFDKTGAAADHPVVLNCPETEYLRASWMRVE